MTRLTRLDRPPIIGFALTSALVLVSCSTSDSPALSPTTGTTAPSRPSASTPSVSPSKSAGRRIDVTVTGKQVKPDPATVNLFERRVAGIGQVPLLVLMVGYTCCGLLLLFTG